MKHWRRLIGIEKKQALPDFDKFVLCITIPCSHREETKKRSS